MNKTMLTVCVWVVMILAVLFAHPVAAQSGATRWCVRDWLCLSRASPT